MIMTTNDEPNGSSLHRSRLGFGLFLRELVYEVRDRGGNAIRQLDELDAGAVGDDVLIDVADARMRDAALDDHRAFAKGETKIVERIELQRKAGFHLHAAMTHLADSRRLKNHYLAVQRSKELDALGISLVVRGHWLGIIA